MKLEFSEPQGRMVLQIDCYLNVDLTNDELVELYRQVDVDVRHPLISDIDISIVNENDIAIKS